MDISEKAEEKSIAENEVRAALTRAGFHATNEQYTGLVSIHLWMQKRLKELTKELDEYTLPAVVFPSIHTKWFERDSNAK